MADTEAAAAGALEDHKQNVETVLTHSVPLWNLPCHRPQCLEAMLYLEMASIPYKRVPTKYSINYWDSGLELPFLRCGLQTTRSVIDFCEGIGNETAQIVGKNNGLNAHLEVSQKADIVALQSLVRSRLHLCYLHQLYGNEANWKEYSNQMAHYLPMLLRGHLLKKERQSALQILTRHSVLTSKHAKELLIDSLHAIYMKMAGRRMNENDIVEIQEEDSGAFRYFFGDEATSFDAVLCAELTLLMQSQLPVKYLTDEMREDPKIKRLLKYCQRTMGKYHQSIVAKMSAENEIEPIEILKEPKKFDLEEKHFANDLFYSKWIDTEEKRNSALFVVGSLAAVVLYCRYFQSRD